MSKTNQVPVNAGLMFYLWAPAVQLKHQNGFDLWVNVNTEIKINFRRKWEDSIHKKGVIFKHRETHLNCFLVTKFVTGNGSWASRRSSTTAGSRRVTSPAGWCALTLMSTSYQGRPGGCHRRCSGIQNRCLTMKLLSSKTLPSCTLNTQTDVSY